MEQLNLTEAREAGQIGMAISLESARKRDPDFSKKAEAAMLRHLVACFSASGEELVDVARAHGAIPHDDRAFGSVFQSMARRGLIRTVGYTARRKGHGTSGGRVWAINQ